MNKDEDGGGGKCDAKKGERHSAGEPVAHGLVSPPSSAAAIVVLLLPVVPSCKTGSLVATS